MDHGARLFEKIADCLFGELFRVLLEVDPGAFQFIFEEFEFDGESTEKKSAFDYCWLVCVDRSCSRVTYVHRRTSLSGGLATKVGRNVGSSIAYYRNQRKGDALRSAVRAL